MAAEVSGLEAQFRLHLFAVLSSPPALRQLLSADGPRAEALRLDLARFLAAYYLGHDFARLFAHLRHEQQVKARGHGAVRQTGATLPNLVLWGEWDAEWAAAEAVPIPSAAVRTGWERHHLAQMLAPECTAQWALYALLRERRWLEALHFADAFNDSRSAMALRFLTDRACQGLSLFSHYCRSVLACGLLDAIEQCAQAPERGMDRRPEGDGQTLQRHIQSHVEAMVQVDVLFPEEFSALGLLSEFTRECAKLMADTLGELVEWDDDQNECGPSEQTVQRLSPLLPRPPIYATQGTTAPSFGDPESRSWECLHHCCAALSAALGRANRLDQLVGFFALWLAQGGAKPESELPFLLEAQFFTGSGETERELGADLDAFQTLVSAVLAMDLRDRVARQMANSEGGADVIGANRTKLAVLARPFREQIESEADEREQSINKRLNGLVWPSLRRWLFLAEPADFEVASLCLHTLQEAHCSTPSRRPFLPPLNALNRPKWHTMLIGEMAGVSRAPASWVGQLDVFVAEEHKFKLCQPDLVRMRFLARHIASVPVCHHSPPRIQMLLGVDPDQICVGTGREAEMQPPPLGEPKTTRVVEEQELQMQSDEEEEDPLDALIAQIRTSIHSIKAMDGQMEMAKRRDRAVQQMPTVHQAGAVQHVQAAHRDGAVQQDAMELPHDELSSEKSRSSRGLTTSDEEHLAREQKRLHRELKRRAAKRQERIDDDHPSISSSAANGWSRAVRRKSKRRTTSSSSSMDAASEQTSDELLAREMDQIAQRLAVIREHFVRKEEQAGTVQPDATVQRDGAVHTTRSQQIQEGDNRTEIEAIYQVEAIHQIEAEVQEVRQIVKQDEAVHQDGTFNEHVEADVQVVHRDGTVLHQAQAVGFDSAVDDDHHEDAGLASRAHSSDGYHSSLASSGGRTRVLDGEVEQRQWRREPVAVERMDFRGLRSSESEPEGELEAPDVAQQPKRRNQRRKHRSQWTEIEVFPRHGSATPPSASTKVSAKSAPPKATAGATSKSRWASSSAKREWPSWMRLLPPFDGAIRSERRPQLLELRLQDLCTSAPSGAASTAHSPRRSFLLLAARNRRQSGAQAVGQKGKRPKEYDSGIGLDQAGAAQHTPASSSVLYSAELGAAEIEEMRRMAQQRPEGGH